MAINAKEIGQRIKKLRIEHKMTQQQLADKLGVSKNHISKIEPGMKVPSLDLFIVISDVFGVSLDYLIVGK